LLAAAQPAAGAPQRPEALTRVLDCRPIADQQQRLACFDAAVAALAEAEAARQVVMVDREQIRDAQRRQFGFEGLRIPFLDGGGDAPDEITTTVRGARELSNGKWTVDLAQGGTWRMLESTRIEPAVGQSVKVKRAALGSFLMSINNRRSVRVVRVR